MLYSTETFSTLSATLTFAIIPTTLLNSVTHGIAISSATTNRFSFQTDTNATFTAALYPTGAHLAAKVPGNISIFIEYDGSDPATNTRLRTWTHSTDTHVASYALSGVLDSVIGRSTAYALSTDGVAVYFGGGTPFSGNYIYGGIAKYNSSTAVVTTTYSDVNSRSRFNTSGANNGSTAGYIGGGLTMPYTTGTTSIMKITYANETLSTISATLSVIRNPARVGIQSGVCAYYGGGKVSGSSLTTSSTTVDRLSFSTDTVSVSSTATVNRDGRASWNTDGQ
jgi:hypothetical protein